IDRLIYVRAQRDQIIRVKKIFVKAVPKRVYVIDLVPVPSVQNEHRMRQGIGGALMICAGDAVKVVLRSDRRQICDSLGCLGFGSYLLTPGRLDRGLRE